MVIHFHGAARTVTGSLHALETSAGRLLVDCGLFQGRRAESNQRNRNLPSWAVEANAVVLTHAHIDHAGNLPGLVKAGFRGPIFATPATRDLCAVMLRDSARIQEADAEYLNRKFADDPEFEPVVPLYTEEDAIQTIGLFHGIPYRQPFQPLPGVRAQLFDAGHILGSAGVALDVAEQGVSRRLVFSGDIGRNNLPILRDPEAPPGGDYVVVESTYGSRLHPDIRSAHADLERIVKTTVARKGKLIVPSFAVGRTQELIFALSQLHAAGRIPEVPIFLDSPLAINVTGVFKLHPECYDAEIRAFIEHDGDPFSFTGLRYVSSREESMRLNSLREPAIIIAASGMCEAGRVLHHLRNNIEDEHNTILIIGFQAQHTLGRRIVERRPQVRILGAYRELHAQVEVVEAFSAHADRDELLSYARQCGPQVRGFFVVHGELAEAEALAEGLRATGHTVAIPEAGEQVTLD